MWKKSRIDKTISKRSNSSLGSIESVKNREVYQKEKY